MTFDEAKEIVEMLVKNKESWKTTKIDIMFCAFATCLYHLLEGNENENNDKSGN